MKAINKVFVMALVSNLLITAPIAIADSKRVKTPVVRAIPAAPAKTLSPASCPTTPVVDTATISNGTTILTTNVGTRLVSSAYSTVAGVGNHTFAMNPVSNGGGKITFDSVTTQITIDSTTPAGVYLETVTATASDTASVTTVINVTVNVLAPVVVPVLDTRTATYCANLAHELAEVSEKHESEGDERRAMPAVPALPTNANRPSINPGIVSKGEGSGNNRRSENKGKRQERD